MVNQYALWAIKDEIESYFIGYENEQVSEHLVRIPITSKTVKSSKQFLGITYKRIIEYKTSELKFDQGFEFTRMKHDVIWNQYKVLYVIDDVNKIVYWKIDSKRGI